MNNDNLIILSSLIYTFSEHFNGKFDFIPEETKEKILTELDELGSSDEKLLELMKPIILEYVHKIEG